MTSRFHSSVIPLVLTLLLTSCSGLAINGSSSESSILTREAVSLQCNYTLHSDDASSMVDLHTPSDGGGFKSSPGVEFSIGFGVGPNDLTDGLKSSSEFKYSDEDKKKADRAWVHSGFQDFISVRSGDPENLSSTIDSELSFASVNVPYAPKSKVLLAQTADNGDLHVRTLRVFNPDFYASMPADSLTDEIHCPVIKVKVVRSPDGFKGFFDERLEGSVDLTPESGSSLMGESRSGGRFLVPQYPFSQK